MGPVFIIRELNKEKGEYDAIVTTGGIQEVRPWPTSPGAQQPPAGQKPAEAGGGGAKNLEDSEYFSMLVTPETVKTLDYPSTTTMNVSLSTLLMAASTRMPWLLVLRRENYPELFHPKDRPAPVIVAAAGFPAAQQPPQRRRYSTRQRRGLYLSPPYAPYHHQQQQQQHYADHTSFEHQLLSTMCYNFVRDYASSGHHLPRLPIALAEPDASDGPSTVAAETFQPDTVQDGGDVDQQQSSPSAVEMTVPKRRVLVP